MARKANPGGRPIIDPATLAQIWKRRRAGSSIRAIARNTGADRETVTKWCNERIMAALDLYASVVFQPVE